MKQLRGTMGGGGDVQPQLNAAMSNQIAEKSVPATVCLLTDSPSLLRVHEAAAAGRRRQTTLHLTVPPTPAPRPVRPLLSLLCVDPSVSANKLNVTKRRSVNDKPSMATKGGDRKDALYWRRNKLQLRRKSQCLNLSIRWHSVDGMTFNVFSAGSVSVSRRVGWCRGGEEGARPVLALFCL